MFSVLSGYSDKNRFSVDACTFASLGRSTTLFLEDLRTKRSEMNLQKEPRGLHVSVAISNISVGEDEVFDTCAALGCC